MSINEEKEEKKQEPQDKKSKKDSGAPNAFIRLSRTYKAEFKKIVWPSRETLAKHTLTVVVVSLIFGAYIALTDGIFSAIFTRFVQLVA